MQKPHHHRRHHTTRHEKMIASIANSLPCLSTDILKAFRLFWFQPLTTRPTPKELLLQSEHQHYKPFSGRATAGLDIYETSILAKAFKKQYPNLTLSQMYQAFDDTVTALMPIEANIIEEDVIACATVSKHKKQAAIELAREKRVLLAKCQTITLSMVEQSAKASPSSVSFFNHLKKSQFNNQSRIDNTLFRLSALRGRIALGKWSPPIEEQVQENRHTKEVKRQFASFRSLIRKKERRQKFLKRGTEEEEHSDQDGNNSLHKSNPKDKEPNDSVFLTQQIDLYEDVDAPPQAPQAEEAYQIRASELGVLPSKKISSVLLHGDTTLQLPHYGLGNAGCDSLCSGLALNRGLRRLDLSSSKRTKAFFVCLMFLLHGETQISNSLTSLFTFYRQFKRIQHDYIGQSIVVTNGGRRTLGNISP